MNGESGGGGLKRGCFGSLGVKENSHLPKITLSRGCAEKIYYYLCRRKEYKCLTNIVLVKRINMQPITIERVNKRLTPQVKTKWLNDDAIKLKEALKGIDFEDKRVVHALLQLIPIEHLLSDVRIYNVVTVRANKLYNTRRLKVLEEQYISSVHSILLLDRSIFQVVYKMPNNPLRGLKQSEINVLCGCYMHSKLNLKVFTAKNLLPWCKSINDIQIILRDFVARGFITVLDYQQVFKLTGKLAKGHKTKNFNYYMITKEGSKSLKGYFEIFKKKVEKMTAQAWDIPLLEILTSKDDED